MIEHQPGYVWGLHSPLFILPFVSCIIHSLSFIHLAPRCSQNENDSIKTLMTVNNYFCMQSKQSRNPCLLNQLTGQSLLMYARIPLSLLVVGFLSFFLGTQQRFTNQTNPFLSPHGNSNTIHSEGLGEQL